MRHPTPLLLATMCCLLAVASFTAPALRGMIAQPPPPLDPESTVPAPSATPSDPVEPREPSHTEAADDSQDSGDAGELSPTPSPSPSPTPAS